METNKSDNNVLQKVIEIEGEITETIRKTNGCLTHFEYVFENVGNNPTNINVSYGSKTVLNICVYTQNPNTKEIFLLKKVSTNNDKISGLEEILKYVKEHKKNNDSYSIHWSRKPSTHMNISYFYCRDVYEALEKFSYNKNKDDYTIYDVKMNPMS